MLPFSAQHYPQDFTEHPQCSGVGGMRVALEQTISADMRRLLSCCLEDFLHSSEWLCTQRSHQSVSLMISKTFLVGAIWIGSLDDYQQKQQQIQSQRVSISCCNKCFASSCAPYIFCYPVSCEVILMFADVIKMSIKMSSRCLLQSQVSRLLFSLLFRGKMLLWATQCFLSHVHKLAIYTSAFCSESAYLICHCFLITLRLGFIAVQRN